MCMGDYSQNMTASASGAGIQLPEERLVPLDGKRCMIESAKGYNVVAWKQRGLPYGLVSDASSAALLQLAGRL